jgi:hypothetical protein
MASPGVLKMDQQYSEPAQICTTRAGMMSIKRLNRMGMRGVKKSHSSRSSSCKVGVGVGRLLSA